MQGNVFHDTVVAPLGILLEAGSWCFDVIASGLPTAEHASGRYVAAAWAPAGFSGMTWRTMI